MIYKCYDCGHIFEDGEEKRWEEAHGEKWTGCPNCYGAFGETVACKKCGSSHLPHELFGGVCEDCINEYKKDFDACYKLTSDEKEIVKISAILVSIFDERDIEQILLEFVKSKMPDVSVENFVESDLNWFGEKIAEEVKNEQKKK